MKQVGNKKNRDNTQFCWAGNITGESVLKSDGHLSAQALLRLVQSVIRHTDAVLLVPFLHVHVRLGKLQGARDLGQAAPHHCDPSTHAHTHTQIIRYLSSQTPCKSESDP